MAKKQADKLLHDCFHPKTGKPRLRKIEPDINRAKEHLQKS